MKHILLIGLFWASLIVPAALFASPARAAEPRPKIAVLVSFEGEQTAQVLDGFQQALKARGIAADYRIYDVAESGEERARTLEALRQSQEDLLFALGTSALQVASQVQGERPLVAGLILKKDSFDGLSHATGVYLEFPAVTQVQWLRRILPEVATVGMLYSAQENRTQMETFAAAARSEGLELVSRAIYRPSEMPGALKALGKRVEVLLGLGDDMVLNPSTAKNLLLFSFRNRIPFVGLSEVWVKAGALYALERDYQDVGRQCGELALKVLRGVPVHSLDPEPPRQVTYSLNLRTAEVMKIEISSELETGAASLY